MSPGVTLVIRAVMVRFGLSGEDPAKFIDTRDRTGQRVHVRQLSVWLCRELYGLSYPVLGAEFGKRDHTTMLSSVRRVEKRRTFEPQVRALTDSLVAELDPDGSFRKAAQTVARARVVLRAGTERAG